jgi:hypothetical protein
LICPTGAIPPYKEGEVTKLILSQSYTSVFNVLDLPSGIIPDIRRVKKEDYETPYTDEVYGEDVFTKLVRESLKGTEGLPIGISVSTLHNEEEKCLGIMSILDAAIKG